MLGNKIPGQVDKWDWGQAESPRYYTGKDHKCEECNVQQGRRLEEGHARCNRSKIGRVREDEEDRMETFSPCTLTEDPYSGLTEPEQMSSWRNTESSPSTEAQEEAMSLRKSDQNLPTKQQGKEGGQYRTSEKGERSREKGIHKWNETPQTVDRTFIPRGDRTKGLQASPPKCMMAGLNIGIPNTSPFQNIAMSKGQAH